MLEVLFVGGGGGRTVASQWEREEGVVRGDFSFKKNRLRWFFKEKRFLVKKSSQVAKIPKKRVTAIAAARKI